MSFGISIPGSAVWDTPKRLEFKDTLTSHSLKITFTSDIYTRSSFLNFVMYVNPKSGLMAKIVHVLTACRSTLWTSLEVTWILVLVQKDGLWHSVPFSHPSLRVFNMPDSSKAHLPSLQQPSQKDPNRALWASVLVLLRRVSPEHTQWFPSLPPSGCRDGMKLSCMPELPIKNHLGSGVRVKPGIPDT